jgi:hypothetical protein
MLVCPSWCPKAHAACHCVPGPRTSAPWVELQAALGVVQWLASPGIPSIEVFKVTTHVVRTHQFVWTNDDPHQLLCPRSPLSVRHGKNLITVPADGAPTGTIGCPGSATQCSHSGPSGRGCHHLCWPVVASPVGERVQGSLLALGCERCEGGWCMPALFFSPRSGGGLIEILP